MATALLPRDAGDDTPQTRPRPVGDRWAVAVGISNYADKRLTLQYAHRDAQDLHDFLLTPAGGAFTAERTQLLLDENATTRKLTKATRTFLGDTQEDDLVLIYIACHGAPDDAAPGKPLYILTHDTDPDDIAGTALPMDELAWSLRHYVRAKRIVIIADTCHSAGLATGSRGTNLSAAVLNRYLEQLSISTPGVAYLTSAREDQRSYEDQRWGGGHGVFTWFLLQGLHGEADGYKGRPRDGVVSLGELAAYVHDRVVKETRRRQAPMLGAGQYDEDLPLAAVGELNVTQQLSLAQTLLEVGWRINDPGPFLGAAREASTAIKLAEVAGAPSPPAYALAGEALLAAAEYRQVADLLGPAIERFGDDLPAASRLHLGLAKAALDEQGAAAELLLDFARRDSSSLDAAWSTDHATWLGGHGGGRVRAFLMGVGKLEGVDIPPVDGPANDVKLIRKLLISYVGVPQDGIVSLVDEEATKDAVLRAFGSLADLSTERDIVIVYFSGSSVPEADKDKPYLLTCDDLEGQVTGLTPKELHHLLAAIPATSRLLFIDATSNEAFTKALARNPVATAMIGAGPGEPTFEQAIDRRTNGAFTVAVYSTWLGASDPNRFTCGELVRGVEERLRQRSRNLQTPLLVGNKDQPLPRAFFAADLWRVDRVRASSPIPRALVEACRKSGWPNGRRVVARDLVAKGRFTKAARILNTVAADERTPWAWLEAAEADLAAEQFNRALEALTAVDAVSVGERWAALTAGAKDKVRALRDARPRALLIGIGEYEDPSLLTDQGAAGDVAAMREFLTTRGFVEADMVELLNQEATRDRIVQELGALSEHAADQLGILYVAANGSFSHLGRTLVPYDGRSGGADDLLHAELAQLTEGTPNLVTILDVGYGIGGWGFRNFPSALASAGLSRGLPLPTSLRRLLLPVTPVVIGAATIIAGAPKSDGTADSPEREQPAGNTNVRGILTRALISAADGRARARLTYTGWASRATRQSKLGVRVLGPAAHEPLFRHRTRHAAAVAELKAVGRAPAMTAADLANQQIARFEEQSPPTYLEVGLALVGADRTQEAIRFLRTARNLYEDPSIRAEQQKRDPDTDVWYREACYHLGKLLYEHGGELEGLTEAITTLRHAYALTPEDPRICLYLAMAIRVMVERQSLAEVAGLMQAYLDAGAPLGRREEIQAFLEERAETS